MSAARAEGLYRWLLELAQVALAAGAVWVTLAGVDVALYEELTGGRTRESAGAMACVMSPPLAERVQAGSVEPAPMVATEVPEATGELAAALARVRNRSALHVTGVREDGVFYLPIDRIASVAGAELHQQLRGGPARLICPTGLIDVAPMSTTAWRNFRPVQLPHAPRVIDGRLYVPVRSLKPLLPVTTRWSKSERSWLVSCGDRTLRAAVPADLFEIVIDRSDRTLIVSYGGERLVRWSCCVGAGNNSPIGHYRVQNKARWAPWITYEGDYIPGGSPRNPLGARWLGTTARGYETGRAIGIHGTNQPSSIGRRISGGCIRLTNRHSIEMYDTIPVGSRVIIQE